ncbi:DNA double-strand break repair nuclease NurA [Candidatus Woesearchaeota archaeon]|nr:DNA double-strand break repair nuclease NurA [Candidatus Woesearchaeota archaeon]
MYDEVIKKILETIDEKTAITSAFPKFSGEGYRPCRIDIKNFHEISRLNNGKSIAFVDGGNAEIIGSANFSLNLVRVCFVIYNNNKKIISKKFETLAFIQAISQNNEIYYKTSFFKTNNSIDLEEMSFSSFDHTLMLGINQAEISSVANAIRRFAELKLAKMIADNKLSDTIVLDGNLQSTLTNEDEYLSQLYGSCSKNNVILCALSKTSSLFTDNGDLLSAVLGSISELSSWFYYPIVEIRSTSHRAEMFFAKFHNKSRHIFRFEIFNRQKEKAEEIINALAGNCADPIFIGYPYGMMEADKSARISNNEKESLKMMFLIRLSNKNIEKYLNSKNAHEILDRISF